MTETPTVAPRKRARGRETAGDMVRSLAAVLVLVGVIIAFSLADQPDPVVPDIDYAAAVAQARGQAREQGSYAVLAPRPLPAGWRATSARLGAGAGSAVTWHLGMVTSSGDYAAVEQTDGDRAALVEQITGAARPAGSVEISGAPWRRLEGGDPEERALVRGEDGVTTVVAGSAPWKDLERLASSLRP